VAAWSAVNTDPSATGPATAVTTSSRVKYDLRSRPLLLLYRTHHLPDSSHRKGSEDPSDPNALLQNDLPAPSIRRRETRPELRPEQGHRGTRSPALGRFGSIHWSRELIGTPRLS
jgi:hypothetical protein